ncbi:MAG: transposase [Thermodesulfobacteriota bacterium]|nr:transposase [Thermodesulfobacteriota bacterium]
MFRTNTSHLQGSLFSPATLLSESKRKKLEQSEEMYFYRYIFCEIREEDFSCLYAGDNGRPNAPVNAMVSALLLMQCRRWTYHELFRQIDFNMLTRAALGLRDLDESPFSPATLFNFQNRVVEHYVESGENLLERVFDHLTGAQLKALKVKTDIQRTDSTFAASNIRSYSRVQLLVELVRRISRVLSEEERKRLSERASDYLNQTSGQYIYRLDKEAIPHELERLGELYRWIAAEFGERYESVDIFRTFQRVYTEHFTLVEGKTAVIASKDLGSGCVQSPDDLDATYRKKGERESRGHSLNIVETCNPENDVNLVVDIAINPNNKDDCKVLEERMPELKKKTPDLEEFHTDAAYASKANDRFAEEENIRVIQSGVRGVKAAVEIAIEQREDGCYEVQCPEQKVVAERCRTRHRARFDPTICARCPLAGDCPTIRGKRYRTLYFDHGVYLANTRHRSRSSIPPDRRTLRANVEATIWEFGHRMLPHGKLKVRSAIRAQMIAFATGAAINFGRLYRYVRRNLRETGKNPLPRTLRNLLLRCQRAKEHILPARVRKIPGWSSLKRYFGSNASFHAPCSRTSPYLRKSAF